MEPQRVHTGGDMSAPSALIAEPVLPDALFLITTVSALGFHVTTVDTFQSAVQRLRTSPTLLVADIRLGEYNGLHLVLRGRAVNPNVAAVVTSGTDDPVLRRDAEQLGATFVVKPTTASELRAAICRTWRRDPEASKEPIRSPFERRRSERRHLTEPMAEDRRRGGERRRPVEQLIRALSV